MTDVKTITISTLADAENAFFTWLSDSVDSHTLKDIKGSCKVVSSLLVRKKVLTQPLMETDQIDQVDNALNLAKHVFGSKKMRSNAAKLLTAYSAYLKEGKRPQTVPADTSKAIKQDDWISFDFTNSSSFERTVPALCKVGETFIEGKNWVRILVAIVNLEISKENPALDALYEMPLTSGKSDRPFLLKEKIKGLNCSELSNGFWINVNWSIPRLMDIIQAFCLHCGYKKEQIVLYGVPTKSRKEQLVDRKPFDIEEAVVLLDVYLLEKNNGITRTKASAIASERLRSLAISHGMMISDSFRSPSGLQNRLRSIAGLYERKESASATGTEAFREAVTLYKEDRAQYDKILLAALRQGEQTKKTQFDVKKSSRKVLDMASAESFLKNAGLRGVTVQELIDAVQPDAAFWPVKNTLDDNLNVIAMPNNRYVHADSFVDLDEAEEDLGKILSTHFAQFGGYSNNQLLFGAASQELSMFLNDNDCENIDAVYSITRYLFEKKAAAGKPYKFYTPHIFETEPDYPMTLRGLMINLARSNGGILHAVDAKNYLQKTMLTYGGMGQLLQIGTANTFLMYDENRYLLSEAIGIDDAWCLRMHDRMDDLFRRANVAYVIPRDISTDWLSTLPGLPQGLTWTHLLLQEILDKYPAIGFKSISADLNQSHHTLAAAFVPLASPLQSFPDVVTLFMESKHELPMRMQGEDFRLELRDAGMLEAGEMIYALPKALADYRFAWTDENKFVYVRGNK